MDSTLIAFAMSLNRRGAARRGAVCAARPGRRNDRAPPKGAIDFRLISDAQPRVNYPLCYLIRWISRGGGTAGYYLLAR